MYTVCVYIYRDHVLVEAHLQYVHDSYISQRQRKKQAEKRALLSENVQIKITLDV